MIPLCSRFDSLAFTSDPFPIGGEINFSRSPYFYSASHRGMVKEMAAKMKKEGWEKKGWRINFKELWNFVGLARAAIEENLEKPVEIKTFFEDVAKTLADKNKPLSWTSPSGMPVSIRCFPWLTTTIQFHIGGKLRQHRLATVQGAEIDKAAAKRQAAPNFVHSCDAAHMALVTNQCVKKGIVDLAMVHDFLDAPLRRPVAFARLFVSSSCECTRKTTCSRRCALQPLATSVLMTVCEKCRIAERLI